MQHLGKGHRFAILIPEVAQLLVEFVGDGGYGWYRWCLRKAKYEAGLRHESGQHIMHAVHDANARVSHSVGHDIHTVVVILSELSQPLLSLDPA